MSHSTQATVMQRSRWYALCLVWLGLIKRYVSMNVVSFDFTFFASLRYQTESCSHELTFRRPINHFVPTNSVSLHTCT